MDIQDNILCCGEGRGNQYSKIIFSSFFFFCDHPVYYEGEIWHTIHKKQQLFVLSEDYLKHGCNDVLNFKHIVIFLIIKILKKYTYSSYLFIYRFSIYKDYTCIFVFYLNVILYILILFSTGTDNQMVYSISVWDCYLADLLRF